MKKSCLALVVLLAAALGFSQQAYDKSAAVELMRANRTELGALGTAVTGSNFEEAAMRLARMASNMSMLLPLNPPKGTKAEWDADTKAFLTAAYTGIAACVAKDFEKLKAAFSEVRNRQAACHGKFR
jgi:cytochrome c556